MKMVKRPTLRHQTAWEIEPHDVLERECFSLQAGDILVTKCIGDCETPVATHRLGDYAPTDIRVRELTKWQEGISQIHASGFMARHRQREQDKKNLTASGMNLLMEHQQKTLTDLYRMASCVPPGTVVGVDPAAPDADMTAMAYWQQSLRKNVEVGEIARINIVESPIDNPLADELFDALFGKPKAKTIIAPVKDLDNAFVMEMCGGVKESDRRGILCAAMTAPYGNAAIVSEAVKSNVKPAIAGLYTMTPVLAFNSKRDARI
jgi:hypothetical protein